MRATTATLIKMLWDFKSGTTNATMFAQVDSRQLLMLPPLSLSSAAISKRIYSGMEDIDITEGITFFQ
ncbi:MAG TPA: hypothetical protein VIH72_14510 [Candidatus Acidoferrales bacterium]